MSRNDAADPTCQEQKGEVALDIVSPGCCCAPPFESSSFQGWVDQSMGVAKGRAARWWRVQVFGRGPVGAGCSYCSVMNCRGDLTNGI